jgi:hypothetical protein
LSFSPEWRNKRAQCNQAAICHQSGNFGHAANIFNAIGVSKAEIIIESVANVVAIQRISVATEIEQSLFDKVGDG